MSESVFNPAFCVIPPVLPIADLPQLSCLLPQVPAPISDCPRPPALLPGNPGLDGACVTLYGNGIEIVVTDENVNGSADLTIRRDPGCVGTIDLTVFFTPGDPGAPGPIGPQTGLQGFQGITGPQGPQGPIGPDGGPGPIGANGPVGPTGFQGPRGPQGPQGFQSLQGPRGLDGLPGPDGSPGADGPAGPAGEDGTCPDPGQGAIPGCRWEFYVEEGLEGLWLLIDDKCGECNCSLGDIPDAEYENGDRVYTNCICAEGQEPPEGIAGGGGFAGGPGDENPINADDVELEEDGDACIVKIKLPQLPQCVQGDPGPQGVRGPQGDRGDPSDPCPPETSLDECCIYCYTGSDWVQRYQGSEIETCPEPPSEPGSPGQTVVLCGEEPDTVVVGCSELPVPKTLQVQSVWTTPSNGSQNYDYAIVLDPDFPDPTLPTWRVTNPDDPDLCHVWAVQCNSADQWVVYRTSNGCDFTSITTESTVITNDPLNISIEITGFWFNGSEVEAASFSVTISA